LRCPSLVAAAIFFHPPAATVRDEDLGLASPAESTNPHHDCELYAPQQLQ
jgi:hypothetical protein